MAEDSLPREGEVPAVVSDGDKAMTYGNDLGHVNKQVGGLYQCQDCGADYTAKTTWQKYCPDCGSKRKKGVMLARKIKARALV